MIRVTLFLLLAFFLQSCVTYFSDIKSYNIQAQKREQETRTALISQNDKIKFIVKLTRLNPLDSLFYKNREYFFLEVYSDDATFPIPDFLELKLRGIRSLWIREVKRDEFDNLLYTQNRWSKGFLVAFNKIPAGSEKNIKVVLKIIGFNEVIFDFSYIVLRNTI